MVRDSLGCSSDVLNLGRHIRLPIDREFESKSKEELDPAEIAKWLPLELREMRTFVLKNIANAYAKNKKYYDQKRRPSKFKVGGKVLLRTHTLSNAEEGITKKFAKRWCGSFELAQEVTPGLTFKLRHLDSQVDFGTHHVYHLRPYFESSDPNRVNVWKESQGNTVRQASLVDKNSSKDNGGEISSDYNLRKRPKKDYKALHNKGKVVNLCKIVDSLNLFD